MPREKIITLYKYDELSERAKARARDWYREVAARDSDSYWADDVIDDFVTIAGFCGWKIKQRDGEPCVYWSVSSGQGDGACFEGEWTAADVNTKALRAHAPKDFELHKLGARFGELKRAVPSPENATARAVASSLDSLSDSVTFETQGLGSEKTQEAREATLVQASRDLMNWLHRELERAYADFNSDESIGDTIWVNEYEFDIDGNRAA